jgi:hypothetical protein
MAAKGYEHKIELILQSKEFKRRLGLMTNFYELEWLGLGGNDFLRECEKDVVE